MKPISRSAFNRIYRRKLESIYSCWTRDMQNEMSRHCCGWAPDSFDFKAYLEASEVRCYRAYSSIVKGGNCTSICDIGGFWGVFPSTLKEIGFDVTMTESLKYYSTAFDALFDRIADSGVKIVDYDPFTSDCKPFIHFDVLTVMAVIEHYPHSLRTFMNNLLSMMNSQSRIYIEVPNIAYLPKRISLLSGKSPLPRFADVYNSEVPFIGHHHEFTIAELRKLADMCELSVTDEYCYNYSPEYILNFRNFIRHPFLMTIFALAKESRECISICAKKAEIYDSCI